MDRYCIIGFPIKHSLSPRLHNRAFRKLKIKARYEACEVSPRELAHFMKAFHTRYAGANVTIPHKEKVIKFLDSVSPEARAIGAVNTIVSEGGKLVGYNTDAYGAMEALKGGRWPFRNKKLVLKKENGKGRLGKVGDRVEFLQGVRIFVLGAGGAARAIVYALKKTGAKVVILNRTLSHAKKLAKEFRCEFGRLEDFEELVERGVDIVINATSVGLWLPGFSLKLQTPLPDLCAVLKKARKKPIIMDIIYRPLTTKFLRDAKAAGCRIITGDKMFLAQAEKSFELWTGTRPKFVKL